jgi:DEAD/DEAH box helicase domain-containing protein
MSMELSPYARPIGLPALLAEWERTGRFADCLAENRGLPSAPPEMGAFPASVPEPLVQSLRRSGIDDLYSHQVTAVEQAAHRHVLIATPTASGKSLAFHLPVLTALCRDPSATALYLYPTKALCRDQESALLELIDQASLGLGASVYDGDTPGDARRAARDKARIVLSNPDMLHSGILPNHPRWASFLQGLSYVVLDELHTYRGVFGSHMAHVLHRLVRIARFHGRNPTDFCARQRQSATPSNTPRDCSGSKRARSRWSSGAAPPERLADSSSTIPRSSIESSRSAVAASSTRSKSAPI